MRQSSTPQGEGLSRERSSRCLQYGTDGTASQGRDRCEASGPLEGKLEGKSLLESKDASAACLGAILGLFIFSSSPTDFLFGCSLFVVLMLTLSTPEVLDVEMQISLYVSRHKNKMHHLVHALSVWPKFLSGQVVVAHASRWAPLVTAYYVLLFLVSDRSIAGLTCTAIALVSYSWAIAAGSWVEDPLNVAIGVHTWCWAIQGVCAVGFGSHERKKITRVSNVSELREVFVQNVFLSPLMVTSEFLMSVGLMEDLARRVRLNVANYRKERRLHTDSGDES